MSRMNDANLRLSELHLRLTLAENGRKDAQLMMMTAINEFTRADAQKILAQRTLEVEDLKKQVEALESSK